MCRRALAVASEIRPPNTALERTSARALLGYLARAVAGRSRSAWNVGQCDSPIRIDGIPYPKLRDPRRDASGVVALRDYYVHVAVRIPTALNEEQRRLLEQLAKIEGETPPERRVLDKVKDFFTP